MAKHSTGRRRAEAYAQAKEVARGLGWFSIGLGLVQLVAPRAVCRIVGIPLAPTAVRLCGLRELACGVGLLTQENPGPWTKVRVAGDAMDLAALAGAAVLPNVGGRRIAVAMAAVAGVTALDVYCGRELAEHDAKTPRHVKDTIVVQRTPEELYRFWRDLENLPRIMPHLLSVRAVGANRYRWTSRTPVGVPLVWDAELIDDKPNERLAWRSLDTSEVYNAGSVRFDREPGGEGTYVTVELLYYPAPVSLPATVSMLFNRGEHHEARADLRTFKTLMETGESRPQ